MKCADCNYYYRKNGERWPRCHYDDEMWPAPCEEEEEYDTPDTDDEEDE